MTSPFPTLTKSLLTVAAGGSLYLTARFTARVLYPNMLSLGDVFAQQIQQGWITEEAFNHLHPEPILVDSRFGYSLHGEWIPLNGAEHTVILSHGISSNRFGMMRYIPLFRDLGFNVLIYDLRGHGQSGGSNVTYGFYERYDLQTLVDWVYRRLGSAARIGTMGISLGAAVSLQHAALDSRVIFTIAEAPFSDLLRLLAFRLKADYPLPVFPLLPLTACACRLMSGARLDQISPRQSAAVIQTPVLLIHGQADSYIPPAMSQEIFDQLSTRQKKIYFVPGARHSGSLPADPLSYIRHTTNFLTTAGVV